MDYRFTDEKPIYAQLVEYFKTEIISGERQPGSRLESVRDLALKAKVNPNTMQKALAEMERIGLVKTERTSGRFVTDDLDLIDQMRREVANSYMRVFVEKMLALGFGKNELPDLITGFCNLKAGLGTDDKIS